MCVCETLNAGLNVRAVLNKMFDLQLLLQNKIDSLQFLSLIHI